MHLDAHVAAKVSEGSQHVVDKFCVVSGFFFGFIWWHSKLEQKLRNRYTLPQVLLFREREREKKRRYS